MLKEHEEKISPSKTGKPAISKAPRTPSPNHIHSFYKHHPSPSTFISLTLLSLSLSLCAKEAQSLYYLTQNTQTDTILLIKLRYTLFLLILIIFCVYTLLKTRMCNQVVSFSVSGTQKEKEVSCYELVISSIL